MNSRKLNILFFLAIGCFMLLSSQPLYASNDKEDIPVSGEWEIAGGKRSLPNEYPISVSWDGTNLFIESDTSNPEIWVSISDGTGVVYETLIPQGSCPAVLFVGNLEEGVAHQLVLTNQFGGRLVGVID